MDISTVTTDPSGAFLVCFAASSIFAVTFTPLPLPGDVIWWSMSGLSSAYVLAAVGEGGDWHQTFFLMSVVIDRKSKFDARERRFGDAWGF